ncbi:unnamed protein product, partial [Rotaria sordida]
MIFYILARKKTLIQTDIDRRGEHDRHLQRNSDPYNRTVKNKERSESDNDIKPTTNSNVDMEKKEKQMYEKADKLHSDDCLILNREMLSLALEWNCLETARDLIIRGSIENIGNPKKFIMTTLHDNLPNFLQYFITSNIPLTQLFQHDVGQ